MNRVRPKGLSKKEYIATSKHHGGKNEHAQWVIPFDVEVELFDMADVEAWGDHQASLWGIAIPLMQLGSNGEHICKFPSPSNAGDAWHGYPIPTNESKSRPPVLLVRRWHADGIVDKAIAKQIMGGNL